MEISETVNKKTKNKKQNKHQSLFFHRAKNMSNGLILKFMCKFEVDKIRTS